jgi:hypothetical protein
MRKDSFFQRFLDSFEFTRFYWERQMRVKLHCCKAWAAHTWEQVFTKLCNAPFGANQIYDKHYLGKCTSKLSIPYVE